jgi:IS1 family transposase
MIKGSNLKFTHMIIDELFTFVETKTKKCYLWASIAVTTSGRYFYFYHLSRKRDHMSLFEFNLDLPKTQRVYSDGCFSYNKIYGDKAILEKSKITNIIENLNSQLRDKISYLVRKTKAHAKSYEWLNNRIAMFFVNKNLNA